MWRITFFRKLHPTNFTSCFTRDLCPQKKKKKKKIRVEGNRNSTPNYWTEILLIPWNTLFSGLRSYGPKYSRIDQVKFMICLSRPYYFKLFKVCLPQILLGPFVNNLPHIILKNYLDKFLNWKTNTLYDNIWLTF